MDNLIFVLKYSALFFKKYLKEYLLMLLKPILIFILGMIFLALSFVHPIFAFIALIVSIPCTLYAFWRGLMITYALNYATDSMIKEENISLKEAYKLAKEKEKSFGLWITFIAFASLIAYIPSVCYVFMKTGASFSLFLDFPFGTIKCLEYFASFDFIKACLVNTLFLVPFLNYAQQAFYFREEKENYFSLTWNCYKNLNFIGYFLALIIVSIGSIMSIYAYLTPLILLFNVFIYPLNLLYYISMHNKSTCVE